MKRIGYAAMGALIWLAGTTAHAGLSTQVGEAVIENLQVGEVYSLKELANLNLIVTNTGEEYADLRMDVLPPEPVELRLQADPIPDISWVRLSSEFFTVAPGAQAEAEIVLAIPDEDKYLGRTFQFTIWSHTLPRGSGVFLAYGLKTRIIFTVAEERSAGPREGGSNTTGVEFSIQPEEMHLESVMPGVEFSSADETGRVLRVTNRGTRKQTLSLKSRKVYGSLTQLTPGYEDAPDASFLRFSESDITLEPGESHDVKLYLNFPANRKYAGHRYMFLVHGTVTGKHVTSGVYSRVYAALE